MPTLLQFLPQIPSFLPHTTPPSHSTHNGTTTTITNTTLQVVASTKPTKTQSQSPTKTNEDDYYATLKALNSKGRSPRKSLGQVNTPPPSGNFCRTLGGRFCEFCVLVVYAALYAGFFDK